MARRPRGDEPDSWHHVINRGIAKRPLFETRGDMRFFLARLVRQVRLERVEIHAFCLMGTHFHLLVRSPLGCLSEAMRRVQNEHSRRFNRMNRRDGALVRGRFRSKPVLSLEYRRALVRYIDANPVRAGIARSSRDYEFGSAAAYLTSSGPRWLTRGWIESEACAVSRSTRFTSAAYRAAFGVQEPGELCELVDARTSSRAALDPFEDLAATAPDRVRDWIERKIRLADGRTSRLPVCGRGALRRALEDDLSERGPWMVEDGRRTWRGIELAWVGLLRDLCCLSWQEIANLDPNSSVHRARRLEQAHRRLLEEDPAYARRTTRVGQVAVSRCLGATSG